MDIISRIEEHAHNKGGSVAFRSRSGEITYADLWGWSDRIAMFIESDQKDRKDPVVVYGHKDPMMLVCFLACVKSGRAYCPLDISMPEDRIRDIVENIGDPLVLCAEDGVEIFDSIRCQFAEYTKLKDICVDGSFMSEPECIERKPCTGNDIYYIIFTSGSTGKPKGVQISTDNLNNYLEWAVTLGGGIKEGAVFLNQAPYSFDLSVMDLYISLAVGGTIISVDKELQSDSAGLVAFLKDSCPEYWVSTPSFADLCLADKDFSGTMLKNIGTFLFCGEVLTNETVLRLKERFPEAMIINTYGPTESTVCVTEVEITEHMARNISPLPVGRTKPGTTITIDPERDEIIITGNTVSPGYFKDPERTAKAFYEKDGWSYRTGDRGHFGEDGMLYCNGRLDNQIKLHGYRMELEDIEANLLKISGVAQAAVVPVYADGKAVSLTAFLVREDERISDDYAGRKLVRSELRNLLPAYMVPKKIKFTDTLPMTVNGKLDRKKLGEMA